MRSRVRTSLFVVLAQGIVMSLSTPSFAQGAPPTTTPAGGASDVPVRKVVLFSSGVGYFEHGGKVSGDASTELRFKSEQINDILKSLVLEDQDGGKVGTVVYPSQDPLSKTLRSFQVDISGNPCLGELLNQLRGAKVHVAATGQELDGIILGLETKPEPAHEGQPVSVWWMNLLAGGVIRAVRLNDVREIQLQDAQLQEELNKALQALAQARDQDKKPVRINFTGQGERRVRLGYVVETPIWKTSYRLILADKPDGKTKLQGWAIVENQTDNDWNSVELSLISGRPMSFIQNLYQPLYIPRPTVRPNLFASLTPQTYGAGIDEAEGDMEAFADADVDLGRAARIIDLQALASRHERKAEKAPADRYLARAAGGSPMPAAAAPLQAAASVASLAAAGDVGELFQYTVGNVSLPRQRSAMIPIVTDDVEAERVSIYNLAVLPKNPLNGAILTNTSGKHLLQGPITVLDGGAYAGDARIEDLPPGQKRLLSYAVDLKVHVSAENRNETNDIQTGKIVKGILHVVRKHVATQEYVIDNKADKDRSMIIEHARRGGWKLVDTPEPYETTDALYRFKSKVTAGKQSKLVVKEEFVSTETLAILPTDLGQLEVYSRTGEIPAKVRDALAKAVQLKSALVDTERKINERKQEIADITSEQNRIRPNMQTVEKTSEYYTRLLKKLNDQETRIEKLQAEVAELQSARDKQRSALEDYLLNLTIE